MKMYKHNNSWWHQCSETSCRFVLGLNPTLTLPYLEEKTKKKLINHPKISLKFDFSGSDSALLLEVVANLVCTVCAENLSGSRSPWGSILWIMCLQDEGRFPQSRDTGDCDEEWSLRLQMSSWEGNFWGLRQGCATFIIFYNAKLLDRKNNTMTMDALGFFP